MKLMTNEEYLASEGARCPWCRSGDLEGDSIEMDGDVAWEQIRCNDCGGVYLDIYRLVGFEVKDPPTENMLYEACVALGSLLDEWRSVSNTDGKKFLLTMDRWKVEKAQRVLDTCKRMGATD